MKAVALSVVVPAYNEVATIDEIVRRIEAAPFVKQIIVVDDGSTDGTRERVRALTAEGRVVGLHHHLNRGKGAAVRTGLAHIEGELVIIQDADLEYSPSDYEKLLAPLLEGKADVVYGSRFAGGEPHRAMYFWHAVGNAALTLLSNALNDVNLTDMECGYKAFTREVAQTLSLQEDGFGFEPELTAKVSRRGLRIYEVGVSYAGRSYEEGKKIRWPDGVWAAWCIVKYRFRA
jgi:glycosyltransferase involved in cell wall biosynthesis